MSAFQEIFITAPNHILADYVCFYQAKSLLRIKKYDTARSRLQQLRTSHPSSRLLQEAAFLEADTWFFQKDYDRAIQAYLALKKKKAYKKHSLMPELYLKLGQAYEYKQQYISALSLYHQARLRYPANSVYDRAKHAEERIARKYPKSRAFYTTQQLLKSIDALTQAGKARDALPFIGMVKTYSLTPVNREKLALKEAYAYYRLRENDRAKAHYRQFLRDDPESPSLPYVLERIGRIYLRQGNMAAFLKIYDQLQRQYPKSKHTAAMMRLKGKEFVLQGHYEMALKEFKLFRTQFPKNSLTSDILWNSGWVYYQLGKYQKALSTFERLVRSYPKSYHREEARYWAGRSAEQIDQLPKAVTYYHKVIQDGKNSYFGEQSQHALTRILQRKPSREEAVNTKKKDLKWDLPVTFTTKQGLLHQQKSNAFLQIGLYEQAGEELAYAIEKDAKSHSQYRELARIYYRSGNYHNLFRVMHGHFGYWVQFGDASLPQEFWTLAFPQSFPALVNKHSASCKLDPYLVQSFILAESAFDPRAFSAAGARGLMQLMPYTGKRLADTLGITIVSPNDYFQPDVNILLGTTYLKELSRMFSSQFPPIIASYNAGEHRVRTWWKEQYQHDPPAFISMIPYRETWKYVQKVLWYYREYHRIYDTKK